MDPKEEWLLMDQHTKQTKQYSRIGSREFTLFYVVDGIEIIPGNFFKVISL